MKALYLLLILLGLFLAYRVSIAVFKSKRKSSKRNPKAPSMDDLLYLFESLATEEIVNGQIKGGYGEFGYSSTNPIPVKGIFGLNSYLGRLITEDGVKTEYRRLGQVRAENNENPVDMYEIKANGDFLCKLFLCAYYTGMSEIAPNGFVLIK